MMDVYLRISDLASWLMLEPLRHVQQQTGVRIHWHIIESSLGNVAGPIRGDDPLADYKARRAAARNGASQREMERMCQMLDIDPEAATRTFDASLPGAAIIWAAQHVDDQGVMALIASIYQQRYARRGGTESLDAILESLTSFGVPVAGFETFASNWQPESAEQLLEAGILSGPAFLLDGEVFLGREHLPLIGWKLAGQQGTPPV